MTAAERGRALLRIARERREADRAERDYAEIIGADGHWTARMRRGEVVDRTLLSVLTADGRIR